MVIKKKKSTAKRKPTKTKRVMSKFPKSHNLQPWTYSPSPTYAFKAQAIECPECGSIMGAGMAYGKPERPIYTCSHCGFEAGERYMRDYVLGYGRYGMYVPVSSEYRKKPRTTRKRSYNKTPAHLTDDIFTEFCSRYDPRESIPETETTKEGWMADIAMVNNKPYIRVASAGNIDVIDRKIRDFVRGSSIRDKVIILKSKVGRSADPAYSDDLGYAYGIYIPMK